MSIWLTSICYGAVGGSITEAVDMWGRLRAWQQARRVARASKRQPPALNRFIDPAPDLAVAFTRALLGGAAGWLLHDEITGMYAALAVGASAPALLAGLGRAVTPTETMLGWPPSDPGSSQGPAVLREPDPQPQVVE